MFALKQLAHPSSSLYWPGLTLAYASVALFSQFRQNSISEGVPQFSHFHLKQCNFFVCVFNSYTSTNKGTSVRIHHKTLKKNKFYTHICITEWDVLNAPYVTYLQNKRVLISARQSVRDKDPGIPEEHRRHKKRFRTWPEATCTTTSMLRGKNQQRSDYKFLAW